jgi:hypothetical protein
MINKMAFLLVMLFTASMAHAQWDIAHAENLDFANGPVGKNLAVDPGLNVHAIFRSDNLVQYYKQSAGSGEWSEAETVNDSLSMGQLGEFSIAWNNATDQPIVAYTANERVWFAERHIDNTWTRFRMGEETVEAMTPDVAVNLAGQIYVIYVVFVNNSYQLEYGFFDDNAWTYDMIEADLGTFGSGASPRAGIESNGAGHVLFRAVGPTGYRVQHGTNEQAGGIGWFLVNLTVPHPESYPGDIIVEPDRTVHCVTQGSEGFGMPRPVYYHKRNPAGMWTFGTLASGNTNAGDPLVAFDSENNGHTVWLPLDGNFYTGEIYYSSENSEWEPEFIFDNIGGGVAFVMDNQNYGHLLMENANGDVLYLLSDTPLGGGTFEPEILITPTMIDFDSVEVDEDSIVSVRLENVGNATLTLSGFDVVGNGFNGPPWIVVNLEPGAFMTTEVQFAPEAEQDYLGRVIVWSNAASSPDTILLVGSGYIFIDDAPEVPAPLEFALHPLYPNPFNGAVNVSFSLPKSSDVSLSVYDVLGREVGQLINGTLNAGEHQAEWNCAECAAGIYLFRLEAAGRTMVQKAVFAK